MLIDLETLFGNRLTKSNTFLKQDPVYNDLKFNIKTQCQNLQTRGWLGCDWEVRTNMPGKRGADEMN